MWDPSPGRLPRMAQRYPVIPFHQFRTGTEDDALLLFAAPARVLASWAGVPRKGWRVRMLYQRWVTPGREREVKAFWDDAGNSISRDRHYLLGPTALTLAATAPLDITEDGISFSYSRPFSSLHPEYEQMSLAAKAALESIKSRLTPDEVSRMEELSANPAYTPAEYEPNHVFTSAIQIAQIGNDAEAFCAYNGVSVEERSELIEALEALCRPALVVDGQHRLLGAALSEHEVTLPVVLIPHASWLEQIYQFVVINETAKRVPSDLLTDIFGNSLTPDEQATVRRWLARSHVQVEARIAAVISGNHPDSPFNEMVILRLGKDQETRGFITEITVRQLIEGGRGGTPGWRTDPEFYEYVVRPTIPDPEAWSAWTSGAWRDYWFAFWKEVGEFYNSQAVEGDLWAPEMRTNLTKAVTLRLLQELFMTTWIEDAKAAEKAAESLREVLRARMSAEEIETIVVAEIAKAALPPIEGFRTAVRERFLAKGVPVRVFEKPWVKSLDDETGIANLRAELRKAYDLNSRGERYRAQNKDIFAVGD